MGVSQASLALDASGVLHAAARLSLLLLVVACAAREAGIQPDPLAGLHFLPAAVAPLDAPARPVRGPATLVLSLNAERLIAGDTPAGADGQAVVRGAMALLRRQDRRLQLAQSLEEAREQRAAATLVLDIRDATPADGPSTVLVTLVTLDQAQMPVSRIEARGSAAAGGFRAAGIEALRRFEHQVGDVLR